MLGEVNSPNQENFANTDDANLNLIEKVMEVIDKSNEREFCSLVW